METRAQALRKPVIAMRQPGGPPALSRRRPVRGRSSNRPKAIRVFISLAAVVRDPERKLGVVQGNGMRDHRLHVDEPDRISLTAVANSSWNRNEPRRSSSFAVIFIIGTVMSPPSPNCTTTPRGRIAAIPPDSARAVPVHSYSTSKYPWIHTRINFTNGLLIN